MAEADSRCPRCGAVFHCGADDPGPCACAGLSLDADLLAELSLHYRGCLCLDCLRCLATTPPLPESAP